MAFQFLCPQGHLLQGDEAHMGMQCQCPQCGMAFIIPTVERPGYAASPAAPHSVQPDQLDLAPLDDLDVPAPEPRSAIPSFAGAQAQLDISDSTNELGMTELHAAAQAETFLHIPCPNGHELETPLDMVGQHALCPHCGVKFKLRREKSIEFLHEQELIDRKRARFWFQLAILAATFVFVVLLAMIVMAVFSD